MSKFIKILETATQVFIGILVFVVVVGGVFAICAHLFKSEIAALIACVILAMLVVQLTSK